MAIITLKPLHLVVTGAAAATLLWTAFFTFVLPWPRQNTFTPTAFLVCALEDTFAGLK